MGLVDFTNPAACEWYKIRSSSCLLKVWMPSKPILASASRVTWSGMTVSPKLSMHNWYTQLYNKTVFEAIEETYGKGRACLFARSATVGGQMQPVHWGGDCESTFNGMAQTLRGGLSLASSGSASGVMTSAASRRISRSGRVQALACIRHAQLSFRLHGSTVYRVPWLFDEADEKNGIVNAPGQTAVDVAREFVRIKLSLMPYLYEVGLQRIVMVFR